MKNENLTSGKLDFESEPTPQEYLDSFLSEIKEIYSYENLKGLSDEQLKREFEAANMDISLLKRRMFLGEDFDLINRGPEPFFDVSNSYDLERPTLEQFYQVKWTVSRLERNFDRAWNERDNSKMGLLDRLKQIVVGASHLGHIKVDFTETAVDDPPEELSYQDGSNE